MDQWISFQVGEETYVHAIDHIKEIIPYNNPVPVPGAADFTEGILNVRGNVITVLSGKSLFDNSMQMERKNARIVILELESEQVCISVDSVGNILSFTEAEVDWSATNDSNNQLIQGTTQQDGQLYILTDFTQINETSH